MSFVQSETLQVATTIQKATEVIIGKELNIGNEDFVTLFIDYVKGDETGLFIIPYVMQESGGTAYQWQTWDTAAGDRTSSSSRLSMTATGNHYLTVDVRGIEYIKFMHQADGGTPTGTLAATYTVTGDVG